MIENLTPPTLYSMISFVVSFLFFVIYFLIKKPDYVLLDAYDKNKKVSLRLAIVYSLLFSSSIGLFIFIIHSIYEYILNILKKKEINKNL